MRDSCFIALRSRTGARQTYLLTATYLEQNPDVHLKKAPTTEKGLLHVPVLVSHGAFPETEHSSFAPSLPAQCSPFGNSCHGTPIAPQCPLLLMHIPLPLPPSPSPNDPQSQPRATYKYNARSVHDVLSTRLAFPNSVMTASVRHSVTSRGPVPAGRGDALMPEPRCAERRLPQSCLLNIGSRGTAIFAFGVRGVY